MERKITVQAFQERKKRGPFFQIDVAACTYLCVSVCHISVPYGYFAYFNLCNNRDEIRRTISHRIYASITILIKIFHFVQNYMTKIF